MKKIFNVSLPIVLLLFATSCDKGLSELNQNKTSATAIDPVFQLNTAIVNSNFTSSTSLTYEMSIVQQMVTPNSGLLAGANFNQDNRDITEDLWQAYYRNVIRNTRDVIARTKDVPARSNLMNMARILQARAFMVLTDSYGNIPYTEAGLGYIEQTFLPRYDAQQDIYPKLITELTEASAALNPVGAIETGEVLYGGNIAQWKKFGYSLLLRAGMRLTKVDAAKAQQVVQAAVAGGVILTNADNAYFRTTNDYTANISGTLNSTEAANYYLAEPFVNYLKTTNDPRLPAIAIRYIGAKSGPDQTPAAGTTDPTRQVGMPMGYDNGTIAAVATAKGLTSFYEFSQLDRRRMAKLTAPVYFVTAAQTNLLLAEAAQRGWITTGTPASYFATGVRAHMEQLATYDAGSAVPASAIAEYLAANPLDPSKALEQINTQYWVASFLNGPEAWANFRRSGFPVLAPNPYPGKTISGTFIRRLTYPNAEVSVNPENLKVAVAAQGPDNLDTRVWWDKQ
ncbi:SusD/RagB family nutrient-binding outer membrane lipoprotein [Segetibacter sp.]|uniref:SusD/RagB family nutrient-binding outer membrane lipoprotein n=1 Tax=Segetibacter sp. TaxID=2231182 RepID=UPI00261EC97C|nr:SusD/RagB family nutrient-binding outer membrane lipoprotein [Segetibacter sp.]MCW3080660.1 SusD/RagB family nutrient-binding outer rane lipoprotein [Segetibacter sp.]